MRKVLAPSLVTLALAALAAHAADWPQFRGPHRDGISEEAHLIKSWPAAGPRVLWRVPVGEGYSHMAGVSGSGGGGGGGGGGVPHPSRRGGGGGRGGGGRAPGRRRGAAAHAPPTSPTPR